MSGQWWESDLLVGPFADIPAANAWAAANPSSLFPGLLATAAGVQIRWDGSAWGSAGGSGKAPLLAITDALGENLWDANYQQGANITDNFYLNTNGTTTASAGYFISAPIPVSPGDIITSTLSTIAISLPGGFYLGSTWVSNVAYPCMVVPAGVDNIRITVEKAYTGPRAVYKIRTTPTTPSIKKVAGMGDSITLGLRTTFPFGKYLSDKLGATFTNLGVGSSTIASPGSTPMNARMNTIPLDSDLVIMEGGYNDFNQGIALGTISDTANTTFYGALNICANYLSAKFPGKRIVWTTTTRAGNWNNLNAQSLTQADYMTAFANVANRRGFILVDAFNRLPSLAEFPNTRLIAQDGLHPADTLHLMWADLIYAAIMI